MKALFIHSNMPGQFKHLAAQVAARGHDVAFITRRTDRELPGVRRISYAPAREAGKATHNYLRGAENAILHGQQVLRVGQALGAQGFVPDIILAHPGWGESLFIKEVFPTSPLILYGEYYFRYYGPMSNFDPEAAYDINARCRTRFANAHIGIAFDDADLGWTPTQWQKSTFPDHVQAKMRTIFDGIDMTVVRPDPVAMVTLADGRVLTAADEVITYVSRNLEPVRGFPTFMRALPEILKARPNAHILVLGDDKVSYGHHQATQEPWRERMLKEVDLPEGRVHFLGHTDYAGYLKVLQISSCHIYLTWPFVLSWSLMEAMAAGCLIVASDTAPVLEVIKDGENGLLTDFFSPQKLAADVLAALDDPRAPAMRQAARETVLRDYALDVCLPQQMAMIAEATGRTWE